MEQTQQITPQSNLSPKQTSPFIKILLALLFTLFVAGVSAGVTYYILHHNQQPAQTNFAPTINPTSIPIPTIDPTADWKTYANSRFGFSFLYPPTLSYLYDSSNKFVENGINNQILLQNFDGMTQPGNKPEDFQLEVIISNTKGEMNMEDLSSPVADTINGIPVTKGTTTIKWATSPAVIFNLTPNKVALILSTPKSTNKDLFDQILSTFKFKDQNNITETANWKTYTSSTGKFTIKYPSDWTVLSGGSIQTGAETIAFGPRITNSTEDINIKFWISLQSTTNANNTIRTAEDYKNSIIKTYGPLPSSSLTNEVLDNVKGYGISYNDAGNTMTNLIFENNLLIYSLLTKEKIPLGDNLQLAIWNEMINSFKFQ